MDGLKWIWGALSNDEMNENRSIVEQICQRFENARSTTHGNLRTFHKSLQVKRQFKHFLANPIQSWLSRTTFRLTTSFPSLRQQSHKILELSMNPFNFISQTHFT